MRGNLKTTLLFLLMGTAAGSFAKADSFDYKYTLHINGVVLPGDGLRLPSVELVLLSDNDVRYGQPALYDSGEVNDHAEPLHLQESVNPSSQFYLNPFDTDYSGFDVSVEKITFVDETWFGGFTPSNHMGSWVAAYMTEIPPILTPNLPAPGQMTSGPIWAFSVTYENPDGSYETALTSYTLRLNVIPEPSPASLLALGLIGIVALMSFRKLPRRK